MAFSSSLPRVSLLLLGAGLALVTAGGASAADLTATWDGTDGAWEDAAHWDTVDYPNNGNGGFTYDAVVDAVGADYTITLGSVVTIEQFELNSANATISHYGGDFTATGGMDLSAGSYVLNGGAISATNINLLGGTLSFASSSGNRLTNGTLLDDDLVLDQYNSVVRLQTGASFSGDAYLTGDYSVLAVEDTTMIDDATINMNGIGTYLAVDGNNTLTLGPNMLVRGQGYVGQQYFVGGANALVNQGTIRADVASQILYISSSSFDNQGVVEAAGGGILNLAGSFTSPGTIDNSAGGTVNVTGTWNNPTASSTIIGSVHLAGGEISGGTLTSGAGGTLVFTSNSNNRLTNGALLDGDLVLDQYNSVVRLQTGASFSGDAYLTGDYSVLAVEDTTTIDDATINMNGIGTYLAVDGNNTLTLGPNMLVRGQGYVGQQYFVGGTNGLINQGTIRADVPGQYLYVSSSSFDNQGAVEAVGGGILTINATNWNGVGGTVDAISTMNLGGTFTDPGAIDNSAGGTVNVTGIWSNPAFTFSSTTGSWNLSGGEVSGGTITPGAGGETLRFTSNSGNRLTNGTLLDDDLVLDQYNSVVRLQTGASFSGDAYLTGDYSVLAVEDTTTIDDATINMNGIGTYLAVDGNNTLTLGPNMLVRGQGYVGQQYFVGGTNGLINQGTIRADVPGQYLYVSSSSFDNQGLAEAVGGGQLYVNSTNWTNSGDINATGGSTAHLYGTWSNLGNITATGGSIVNFGGVWDNAAGSAALDATSVFNLGGSFTTPTGAGTIDNSAGGTVNVTGVWDNSANSFQFDATTGSWNLVGGEVSGGTITPGAGGETLRFTSNGSNRLTNGALFDGDLVLDQYNSVLRLQTGASFSGDAYLTGDYSVLAFEDTTTIDDATINMNGIGTYLAVDGANTLTLGPNLLVRGQGYVGSQYFVGGGNALVNQGTISADVAGQYLYVSSSSFDNQGVAEAVGGGQLYVNSTSWTNSGDITASGGSTAHLYGTWSNLGNITASGGSTVNFGGVWDNAAGSAALDATSVFNLGGAFTTPTGAGTIDNSAGGTVNVTGVWDNSAASFQFDATTGSWNLYGGEVSGGTITPGAGGETLVFTSNSGNRLTNGALFDGDLVLDQYNSVLRLQTGASFSGDAYLTGDYSILGLESTSTLDNKTIHMNGYQARVNVEGNTTLTLGPNMLVRGQGYIGQQYYVGGANALINQGAISADVAGQYLYVYGDSFDNQGLAEATGGGQLYVNATNWTNSGDISATGGSTAHLYGTWSNLGNITASGGSTVNFGGVWDNAAGSAALDATSVFNLGGSFTTPTGAGTIDNSAGGTVNVTGVWDNSANNFQFDATTGSWNLYGGEISGGTITPGAGGETLRFTSNGSNRLTNGALFDGDLVLDQYNSVLRLQTGATFSGDAYLTGDYSHLAFEHSTTIDDATIHMDGYQARLTIEGNTTLTLGPDMVVRGQGYIGQQYYVGGPNALINQGTISADVAGQYLYVYGDSFDNQGLAEAVGGGQLVFYPSSQAGFTNISGNTLTGGRWRASGSGSVVSINAAQIQTNAAEIILDGVGSAIRSADFNYSFVDLETTLTTNAVGGTLRVLGGRDYAATAGGAFANDGTLELGGGAFSAPMLSNAAPGLIFGHGTINNTILNSGTVRAAGGTLAVVGGAIDGQSGTVQIDAGATLDLSGASGASDGDFLVHNGAGLNLGGNNFLVAQDYTNANFGVGNAFDPRANVTGAGQINASPGITQTLGGQVSNGATPTGVMNFGNVHVGSAASRNYLINSVGASGPSLRGAVQTSVGGANLTDARLSGMGVTAGNFGPIAAGGNSGNRLVTFTPTTAGALVNQRIRIANNFDNVGEQILQFTGAAYRLASPTAHTPEPVNLGNRHVGDAAPSQAISLTNNVPADGFSESLNASIGSATGGVTTNAGSFTGLAPAATNNTSLSLGYSTATAGNKAGTATVTLTSNGTGSSGLGLTALASQTVNVTGGVYRYANPTGHTPEPVNLGNRHVGDPAPSQTLSLTNNVTADGFSESLNASIGSATGDATTNGGSFTGLAAGTTNSTSLSVGYSTATAGNKSGTATIALTSNGAGSSGLGLTALASQTVNVAGTVYRLASAGAHAPEPVSFGIIHVGDVVQQALSISNTAANDGFSERLNGSIGSATGSATTNSGSFTGLTPGAANTTSLAVGVDTATAGVKTGTATISLASTGVGTSGLANTTLASQTVNVQAQVNRFAVAEVVKVGGSGTLMMTGPNVFSYNIGTVVQGMTDLTAQLGILNNVAAPADDLAGAFAVAAPGFITAGFSPFAGLAAGGTQGGLMVTLDSATPGAVTGQIALSPQSTNPRPFSMNLAAVTINLTGLVVRTADFDEDGDVDGNDLTRWRNNFGTGATHTQGDADGDLDVDGSDLLTWQRQLGSAPAVVATEAVPEPSAALLALLALGAVTAARRR